VRGDIDAEVAEQQATRLNAGGAYSHVVHD
jgi:hypothetical protein